VNFRKLAVALAVVAVVPAVTGSVTSAAASTAIHPAYVADYETYTTVSSTPVYVKPGGSADNQFLFHITGKGAAVDIKCWKSGSSVSGDKIWYKLYWMGSDYVVPGFAPGADVATGHDPNSQIAPC
jgi:hypothetical protein